MSKLDQLRAMREAESKPGVAKAARTANPRSSPSTVPPGPALNSAALVEAAGKPQFKPKGRPLDKDRHKALAALQPWKAEGMSRATWFRRKRRAEGKA